MYKLEKRGLVTRYYNEEKMKLIYENKTAAWKEYRDLWDRDPALPWHGRLLEVLLELTSWCNYTCKMCFKNFHRQTVREHISLEMIRKVVDEAIRAGVYSFWVGAFSEGLLHPQIEEALEILLSAKTLDFTLLTNGSRLNERIMKLLIEAKARQLSVSLDAATSETYRKIRGANLKIVEDNINRFLEMRGDALFPILRVSMVELEDNLNEREAFLKKWEGRADIIDYQAMTDYSEMDNFNNISRWHTDCRDPFRRLFVDYKGNIFPCCTEYARYYPLGNIMETTLQEAWTGKEIASLRGCLQKGDIPLICRKCMAY